MDRNRVSRYLVGVYSVALRKESVDRNNDNNYVVTRGNDVALRKESVDRNISEDVL